MFIRNCIFHNRTDNTGFIEIYYLEALDIIQHILTTQQANVEMPETAVPLERPLESGSKSQSIPEDPRVKMFMFTVWDKNWFWSL